MIDRKWWKREKDDDDFAIYEADLHLANILRRVNWVFGNFKFFFFSESPSTFLSEYTVLGNMYFLRILIYSFSRMQDSIEWIIFP